MRKCKVIRHTILSAGLLLAALVALPLISGCGTTATGKKIAWPFFFFTGTTNNIEAKSYRLTRVIVHNVLKDRGTNAIPKLQIAADDLQVLAESPAITPEQVVEILNRAKVIKDPDTAFYVEEGILLLTDDAGTIGAQNPDQLRAVARGGQRGIVSMLANLPE